MFLAGIASDSGGGGTGKSLQVRLIEEGFAKENTRIVTCSLHNLQTCLRNAVEDVFGEGGTVDRSGELDYKINAMQLMNGVYNMFAYLDLEVLKCAWDDACVRLGLDEQESNLPRVDPMVACWSHCL